MNNDEIRRNGISLGLIAKEEAMQNINTAIDLVVVGKSVLLDLSGSAGLGKSRLKMETRKKIYSRCDSFILLEARPNTKPELPYSIIVELLFSYINFNYLYDIDNVRLLLSKCEYPAIVEKIFELLYILPGSKDINLLEGEKRKIALCTLLKDFFAKISENKSLFLFLEDIHLIDESSNELLWTLINDLQNKPKAKGLLVFISHEGETLLKNEPSILVKKINLNPLTPSESSHFITSLLASPDVPTSIVSEIVSKSGGNPLLLEEALKLLIDRGCIYKIGDKWFFKTSGQIEIPSDLSKIVTERLSLLPENSLDLLQFASTIGLSFGLQILKNTSEDNDFPFYLEELSKRKILFQVGSYHDAKVIFKHYKIQEIIYDNIPIEKKRNFHEKIAKSIEVSLIKTPPQNSFYLSFHLIKAGKIQDALKFLEKSASISISLFSLDLSKNLLMQALDYLESIQTFNEEIKKTIVKLYSLLAKLYSLLKNFQEGERSIRKSLEHAEDTKDLKIIANAYRELGVVKREKEAYLEAVECFQMARKIAANSRDLRIILEIERDIGVALRMKGDFENALIVFQKAFDMSSRIGYDDLTGLFMNNIGMLYQKKGELEIACLSFKKAFEIKNKLKEPKSLVLTINDYVFLLLELGNYDEASLLVDKSIELSEQIFDYEYFIRSLCLKSYCELKKENYPLSKELFARAQNLAKTTRHEITEKEIKRWEEFLNK